MLLLTLAAAVQAATVPALPGQAALYRVLFADIRHSLASNHTEVGFSPHWAQGHDVNISELDCAQDGAGATCRFLLTRTPDGSPRAVHAGTGNNILGCRVELRHARGPDGGAEAWRVRVWPGRGNRPSRSTMRCNRHRAGA